MSALTPHIRVLRAVGESAMNMGSGQSPRHADFFAELAWVIFSAADKLQAEEAALQPPREGADKEITFVQKGKL